MLAGNAQNHSVSEGAFPTGEQVAESVKLSVDKWYKSFLVQDIKRDPRGIT